MLWFLKIQTIDTPGVFNEQSHLIYLSTMGNGKLGFDFAS